MCKLCVIDLPLTGFGEVNSLSRVRVVFILVCTPLESGFLANLRTSESGKRTVVSLEIVLR
jgi:hypothetical protein